MKGHPLHTESNAELERLRSCHFVFEDVRSSVRYLTPYLGDPMLGRFGEKYTEVDGSFGGGSGGREYGFEGRMECPVAIVDWVIVAGSFTLLVP